MVLCISQNKFNILPVQISGSFNCEIQQYPGDIYRGHMISRIKVFRDFKGQVAGPTPCIQCFFTRFDFRVFK